MITLEQVQKLDAKIKQAVSFISTLREENAGLRSTLSNYENKITDLESMVLSLEDGQTKIEMGLMDAISKLDNLDLVEKEKEEEEESFEELSPSEETAIVNNINIDENDHSEQAENTTEDSLSSTKKVVNDENFSRKEITKEIVADEIEVVEETTDEVEVVEETTDEVEVVEETTDEVEVVEETTDEVEVVEETTDDIKAETTNNVVEKETTKKKSSDYSIPMLEIF